MPIPPVIPEWNMPVGGDDGDVVTRYQGGVAFRPSTGGGTLTFSNQAGTTYTFALGDANTYINFTSGDSVTATVPANGTVAFPVGIQIMFEQAGDGQVTIAPVDGTVTIDATPTLKTSEKFAVAVLIKKATNTWTLTGNLATS